MKPRFKSILILVVTLAIGIAIGAMSWGTVHNMRIERMREVRNQGGLYSNMDRYIDPVDTEQEDALREIASRYSRKFGLIYRESGRRLEAEQDSLRIELNSILTPAQQEAIKPMFHRGRRSGDGDDDRGGGGSSDDGRRDREDDSRRDRSRR